MISKELTLSILRKNYPMLKQKYHLESMELFGSVSRGDSNAKYIDLLITYDENFSLYDLMDFKTELESLLNEKVDVVCKNSLKEHISQAVAKDLVAI